MGVAESEKEGVQVARQKVVVVHKHQRAVSPVWRGIGWLFAAMLAIGLFVAVATNLVPTVIGAGTGYYATRTSPGNRIRGMFFGGSLGLLIGVIGLFAMGDSTADDSSAAAVSVTVGTSAPTPAPAGSTDVAAPAKSGPQSATISPATTSWIMPDLVGHNLQDAQDQIQGLTDSSIFLTMSHDASGRGRFQVLDSGWIVCDQNVAPGAGLGRDIDIDFGVVRNTEVCP